MAKRIERVQRNRDQYPPVRPQNPEKLTEDEMNAVLLEVLQISPPCSRLATKIFRYPALYGTLVDTMNHPAIADYASKNIDFSHISRFGHYSRVLNTVAEFRAEVQKFLKRPEHMVPDTRSGLPTKDDIANTLRRYRNFEKVAGLVIEDAASYAGAWMSWMPRAVDLSPDNAYLDAVKEGMTVGEILLSVARELPYQSINLGHSFDSVQYTDLIEVLYSIVRREAAEVFPTIQVVEEIDQEKLSKVILDMTAAFEYHLPAEVRRSLPSLLRNAYSDGLPLYRVLFGLVRQFTEALVHDEHLGHQVTWKLFESLNQFELEGKTYHSDLTNQMFTFLLGAGQIQLEFSGRGDYQELILNLETLAKKDGPRKENYQQLLDFMIRCSTHFPHKVLTSANDLNEELFDLEQVKTYTYDFADRLRAIFKAGQYEVLELTLNEHVTPIAETSLRGEKYDTVMIIKLVDADHFVIDMMTTTVQDRAVPHELGYRLDMRRFRCQLFVSNGRISTFIPVAYRDQVNPAIEEALINHAKLVVGLVDISEVEAQTLLDQIDENSDQSSQSSPRKLGTREERKAAYQAAQQVDVDHIRPVRREKNTISDSLETVTTESEQFALYVPHELILSSALSEEIAKAGKKGSRAKVLQDTAKFFSRYNSQSESKPGKGIPMTAVTGPNGERIWRFYVNYDVRCIAVEVGGGKALVVMTEDHDGAYKDYDKISNVVAQALERYQEESDE